nr:hypothetical protein [uncultured Mediterraneibacter sp.]
MMEWVITPNDILAICTLVAAVFGVYKIWKEVRKPNTDLKEAVQKHTEYLANDDRRLKEVEQSNKMILQGLLVLINHDITGNGVDKLKETRDELNEYLINK